MTPLRLVAYVNGARIFPSSVNASFEVGSYAQFALTVPSVPDWTELPVRSVISVFYTDPIDQAWRLLVDGEYIGRTRAKTGAGTRSFQLMCRGHLAWTTSQTFATLGGAVLSNNADKVGAQLSLVANGFQFNAKSEAAEISLQTIPQFFASASSLSPDITQLFRRLLRSIAYQSPVDAFYYKFRDLFDMLGAVPDTSVQKAFTNNRFIDLLQAAASRTMAPDQNASVESVLQKYMEMAFYRHTPIPSPPSVKNENTGKNGIKSQFLVPLLYETVPPACNIIFADQVVSDNESINWLAVPTRVTTRLSIGVTNQELPVFYVSTDASRAVNLSENQGTAITMLTSHGLFSQDELTRGVRNVFTDVRLENAEVNKTHDTKLDAYMDATSRYNYSRLRGEALRRTFQCQFLPYVMPGFPGVVEDLEGSIYGYIESVTHSIDHTGVAATTISMSHIRDLRVRPGYNKNGPLPVWLNDAYKAANVDKTYADYFGMTTSALRGKEAVSGFYETVTGAHSDSVDPSVFKLDDFLSSVIFVNTFNVDGVHIDAQNTVTTADQLRAHASPAETHRAMLTWQYRQGTTIEDYAKTYGFTAPPIAPPGVSDPPLDLTLGVNYIAYGTPIGLQIDATLVTASKAGTDWPAAQDSDLTKAGIFNLVGASSTPGTANFQSERQVIARLVSDRLSTYSIERTAVPGDGTPLVHRGVTP